MLQTLITNPSKRKNQLYPLVFKSVLILVFLIVESCEQKLNCEVDKAFEKQFNENINFLIASETDTSFLYQTTDKIKVVYFLERITGIKSQIYNGDVYIYQNARSLREDLYKWRNWYKINQCKMTKAKADSIMASYLKNN